ncbi:tetratricopeptide repeat protein [Sporolactobacillus sp. Y61]|uniref:Tetratricopeptide repeat protein n=1 Tax=Sporolactobacillus sp. Y61 TaxID=3160863 RepID=A0AAU8IDS7_9BACL
MCDSADTIIQKADLYLKEGQEEACLRLLRDLSKHQSDNGRLCLKYALALDHFSREEEAIPAYKKAMDSGLDPDDERVAMICLASSYRNVGKVDQAMAMITGAMEKYPGHIPVECFCSLILLDAGLEKMAVQQLVQVLLRELKPEAFEGFKEALKVKVNELTEEKP